jgi:hypothetical protein
MIQTSDEKESWLSVHSNHTMIRPCSSQTAFMYPGESAKRRNFVVLSRISTARVGRGGKKSDEGFNGDQFDCIRAKSRNNLLVFCLFFFSLFSSSSPSFPSSSALSLSHLL